MKLYALCDQEMLDNKGISLENYFQIIKKNSATIVQYRNKNSDISFIKQQLLKIRKLYFGTLIVNDHYELAPYCDGVHLGQEDLLLLEEENPNAAITYLRKHYLQDKLLGLSTHNLEEIQRANQFDLDYIGLGAYRDTTTKKNIQGILGDRLDLLAASSIHKVAAIGGVQLEDKFENVYYHVIGSGLIK